MIKEMSFSEVSDDFYENDDNDRYQNEVKVFERAGHGGKLYELLSNAGMKDKKGKDQYSPEDRILIGIDAVSRRIIDNQKMHKIISVKDIDIILEKSFKLPNFKYKNSGGLVLGYICSRGGRSIDKNIVKIVFDDFLPLIQEESGLTKSDVIRYSRLWLTII